jgi:hypothetical protein
MSVWIAKQYFLNEPQRHRGRKGRETRDVHISFMIPIFANSWLDNFTVSAYLSGALYNVKKAVSKESIFINQDR